MRDIYDTTLDVINEHLNKGLFTLSELENKIRSIGAPMRVAPAFTVDDYLDILENNGSIIFEYKTSDEEIYIRHIHTDHKNQKKNKK